MKSASDLLIHSIIHKSKLHKHFFEGYPINKTLTEFQRHELNAMLLLSIEKPIELCRLFKTSIPDLENIINNPTYVHFIIPKQKNGEREIFAPSNQLKSIQRRLNYFLQAYYLIVKPIEVHGFVINPHYLGKYCNIVENARKHTKKKFVLNIDLKDFFPSIAAKQVLSVFHSDYFNFSDQVATAIALLTTFEGTLPVGAPSSPVISNFVCLKLDQDLKTFSQRNSLVYSRYADDLTFSSELPIRNDDILDLINIISNRGFAINEKKLRLNTANRRQTVTGLTVNDKVNVNRKLLRKIRAMLHDVTVNGIDLATQRHFNLKSDVEVKHRARFIQQLEGYINFVGQVRGKFDPLYTRQKSSFDNIFKPKTIQ